MASYTKAKIFYISIGFWLISGVECYSSWSNYILTVQTGGSVTIPCHYDEKYTQQKKYWFSEIDKSKTYTNTTEKNLSVIDHPVQSLFTVTLRNLQNNQTGYYYCVVETGEQPAINIIYEPHLKIQSAPDVFVGSSSVSGHEGGDISVQCLYSSGYKNKVKRWCRYKDQSCYTVGRTNTSQSSSVQISDDGRRSFTVLMTGLRLTDSGWYFCFVGQALNPVHLTVTEAKSDKEKDTDNELLTVWLPVSAVFLLLLILVGVFIWRWRRRPKQDQHQIRKRNDSTTIDRVVLRQRDQAHDVIIGRYSFVQFCRRSVSRRKTDYTHRQTSQGRNDTTSAVYVYEMTGKWIWTQESAEMGECPCAIRIACAPATLTAAMAGRNGTEDE